MIQAVAFESPSGRIRTTETGFEDAGLRIGLVSMFFGAICFFCFCFFFRFALFLVLFFLLFLSLARIISLVLYFLGGDGDSNDD